MSASNPDSIESKSRTLPISTALALMFGTLMVIAVSTVLGIVLITSLANTRDLLIDVATSSMNSTKKDVINLLSPAEEQIRFLANMIHSGQVDPHNRKKIGEFLTAGLAGTPQIQAIAFISRDFKVDAVNRQTSSTVFHEDTVNKNTKETVNKLRESAASSWGPVTHIPDLKLSFLNFGQPITKDGKFVGVLLAAIPVTELDRVMTHSLGNAEETKFVLYGKNEVLSHPDAEKDNFIPSVDDPLPSLDEINDEILSSIWQEDREPLAIIGKGVDFDSHYLQVNGEGHLFFYSSLYGYADKPLIVGFRLVDRDATREFRRLAWSGVAGVVVLVISILAAVILGRKISEPVRTLSEASQQISKLDFSGAPTLPKSRFKELNEAAEAYETMVRGLTWFENYVPKTLVRKLIQSGEAQSEERHVSVMFTDIVGFTTLAENMSATEVADFLNSHFEIITGCIEREGGTVDKFIGDAVMAFWGAPDDQEDHADRACRAAKAIAAGIRRDNTIRRNQGLAPIKMRIGVHTGTIIVGNIGSKGRFNYTIVGDTVNVGQRLEQLGKQVTADKEGTEIPDSITLISGSTKEALQGEFELHPVGQHGMRGHQKKIDLYELV